MHAPRSIRMRGLAMWAVLAALAVVAANGTHAQSLDTLEQTSIRDDRDVVPNRSGMACQLGSATEEHPNPAAACFEGYQLALRHHRYEDAMSYAVLGCRVYLQPADCRRAGGLPLVFNNRDIAIPASFGPALKGLAEFVCLSGARLNTVYDIDVTGRDCSFLARTFVLLTDSEYVYALEPRSRAFYRALYEPARALKLYEAACRQLAYAPSCAIAADIARAMNAPPRAAISRR